SDQQASQPAIHSKVGSVNPATADELYEAIQPLNPLQATVPSLSFEVS
ncbi:hypothetical protein L917_07446, partial [Phytophthora nicotianae]